MVLGISHSRTYEFLPLHSFLDYSTVVFSVVRGVGYLGLHFQPMQNGRIFLTVIPHHRLLLLQSVHRLGADLCHSLLGRSLFGASMFYSFLKRCRR